MLSFWKITVFFWKLITDINSRTECPKALSFHSIAHMNSTVQTTHMLFSSRQGLHNDMKICEIMKEY